MTTFHVRGGPDLLEVDVNPVGEGQGLSGLEPRGYALRVEPGLLLVVDKDHDEVRRGRRVLGRHDLEPLGFRFFPALGPFVQAHDHGIPGVPEIQRMRVALLPKPTTARVFPPGLSCRSLFS
jgi:hypothetical protein